MSESNLPVRVVEGEWRYDRDRYVAALPALDGSQMIGLIILTNALTGLMHGWWPQFAICGSVFLGITITRSVRQRRAMRLILSMAPDGAELAPGQLGLVHIQLFRDDVYYGDDIGMLSIDAHYLHFEGAQTSFSTSGWRLKFKDDQFQFIDRPDLRVVMRTIEQRRKSLRNLPIAAVRQVVTARFTPDPGVTEPIVGLPPTFPIKDLERRLRLRNVGTYASGALLVCLGVYAVVCLREPPHPWFAVALGCLLIVVAIAFSMSMIFDARKSIAAIERWDAEDAS